MARPVRDVEKYPCGAIRGPFESAGFLQTAKHIFGSIVISSASRFVRQIVAFSHWTYQVTEGYLMVVDLQGIISAEEKTLELTDPAIHCTDLTRFGRTNLGKGGMRCFFGRHQCNEICKNLGLIFPVEMVKVEGR